MGVGSSFPPPGEETALFRSASTAILAANRAVYLTGTIVHGTDLTIVQRPCFRLRLFDGFLRQRGLRSRGVEGELAVVSTILKSSLTSLARSWPPGWVPAKLGVMTDGSGIVFSPELPDPEEERWSERLISKDVCSVELLPFATGSPWSMFNVPASASRH